MTTKQQLATAEEIVKIVETIVDRTIYDEATRVLSELIALSRFMIRGEVKTITRELGEEMHFSLLQLRNLVAHGVWTNPGNDIPSFVTTDDEGNFTQDSELYLNGLQRIRVIGEHNRDLVGKPVIKHMTQIAIATRALGFVADLSDGTDALTFRMIGWHHSAGRKSRGYAFVAKHGRK